jgi:hypothetical protein
MMIGVGLVMMMASMALLVWGFPRTPRRSRA